MVQHFLSRTYSERTHSEWTLSRNIFGAQCKEMKSPFYAALYLRYTGERGEELILATIAAAPEHRKSYIK